MHIIETQHSALDATRKIVCDVEGQPVEVVYVDNGTGKDIVCVPSQTSCNLGCTFCCLTLIQKLTQREVHPLPYGFTAWAIDQMLDKFGNPNKNRTLLISFMGAGEPLLNMQYLRDVISDIAWSEAEYKTVRFAIATMVPKAVMMVRLMDMVQNLHVNMKVHWSLHHPVQEIRAQWMPNAAPVHLVAPLLEMYHKKTGNAVEVHYTLFDGNDDIVTAHTLADLLLRHYLPVKFLAFTERPDHVMKASPRRAAFIECVRERGVIAEEYTPPGADINAGCGAFDINLSLNEIRATEDEIGAAK